MVADFIGDTILGKNTDIGEVISEFDRLSKTDRTLFQKIMDTIKDWLDNVLKRYKNRNTYQDIKYITDRLSRLYDSGTKTATENGDGVKYEISVDADGNKFVIVDNNAINTSDGKSIASNIARLLKEKFDNLLLVNGQYIRVNSKTNKEFRNSDWARSLKNINEEWYNDKLKSLSNADELLTTANNWINENIKHERNDNIVSFGRGNVQYKVGNNEYVADILVGIKNDGSAVLYDIIKIKSKKIVDATGGEVKNLSSGKQSTKDIIPTPDTKSQEKFSDDSSEKRFSLLDKDIRQLVEQYDKGLITKSTFIKGIEEASGKRGQIALERREQSLRNRARVINNMQESPYALAQRLRAENSSTADFKTLRKDIEDVYDFAKSQNQDWDAIHKGSSPNFRERSFFIYLHLSVINFSVDYYGFYIEVIIYNKQIGIVVFLDFTLIYAKHCGRGFGCHFYRIVKRNTERNGGFYAMKQRSTTSGYCTVAKSCRTVL